uniref:Uncharacterized protein n=1 Tax=Chlorobium chlorochromatii (strain CaD3) TaxID=340177 RepID=Q3ASR3_CHLCH
MSKREELLQSYENGNFLETVYACSSNDHNDRSSVVFDLVALNNEGLIDVVGAFQSLKNESSNSPDFFLTRHVFEKALPELEASVPAVMHCVLQLYLDAGQDLAASTVINSFFDFCTKKASRPHEALEVIKASPGKLAHLLPATLIAGSQIDSSFYLCETMRLCKDENIELKRWALFSIGKLNLPEDIKKFGDALSALEYAAVQETDDQILSSVIKSAFPLLQRDKSQEPRAIAIIISALRKGDDYVLHAASEIFGFYTGELPTTLREAFFVDLLRVKPTHKGTLDNVDYGISHLLKNGNSEQAIQFLEALLLRHSGELTIEVFDSAISEIVSNKAFISKVLTRWFLRGDRVLCEAVHEIVWAHHGSGLLLEIDVTELNPSDSGHILFIARKAIGYLFMQPLSAASVLISLMRNATDDKVLKKLGELLLDPLLLNYTGKARDYIIKQSGSESGKVKETIDNALKDINTYLEELRSVGSLSALHPSEAQREAYNRHYSQLMAESWKAAEAKSVVLNLFPKSVLLYGKKLINYVYGSDGQSHRQEIPLQCLGSEMEYARMHIFDPFGMDYMLRVFRNEQLKT